MRSELETNDNTQMFETFYQGWLISQEHYLEALLQMVQCNRDNNTEESEVQCKELVDQVLAHYSQYYEARSRVASEDVFLVLTPTWFSSFELSHLWIGGFKPGLAFRLVINNVLDLTEDQSQRMNALKSEVNEEENELTNAQQGMEIVSMVEMVRHVGRVNEVMRDMESTIERLRVSMEILIEGADFLRRKTVVKVLDILTASQGIRFLAAAVQLQIKLRRWGMQRDAENQRNNAII
ncbi:transcription factor-related [Abeliophyllum distichum]|uniref:Transcription factor-related n=1 Tax=Abeliophyllum distichum TaxID=126358 RepID=A0ABD1VWQ9_9LAMI